MPKVHFVKSARKDNPVAKKGESYYHWKFRYGGKQYSKDYPKPYQVTQSEFYIAIYEIEERIDALKVVWSEDDQSRWEEATKNLQYSVEDITSDIRQLAEDQEGKLGNMPDSLQDGDTGTLLQERTNNCNEWADRLESVDYSIEGTTQTPGDILDAIIGDLGSFQE